jgi:DNA-binding CsgD family transcriptional regulator
MEIVGRKTELDQLRNLVTRATSGLGGCVVVVGEAGIGKTRLLKTVGREIANEVSVRFATGIPTEQSLPYGALYSLLLHDEGDHALISEDPVLSAVTGKTSMTTPPQPIAVASALLSHLSLLGETKPLVLIVDDLQWIDPSSATALLFAGRRLLADRAAILFGMRTDATGEFPHADEVQETHTPAPTFPVPDIHGIETMILRPLTNEEGVDFLRRRGVSIPAANRVAPRTGGLPLALTEVALRLVAQRDNTADRVDVDLPKNYVSRIEQLNPIARNLCVAAAIDSETHLVAKVIGADFEKAIAEAEAAGIIHLEKDRIAFRHPMLRAASLSTATSEEERRFHSLFANALSPSTEQDRIALHRASAALGIDDSAAQSLSEFARRAYSRGALHESADALLRAALLTTDKRLSDEWTLDAAQMYWNGGDARNALMLAERLGGGQHDEATATKLGNLIALASQWERDPKTIMMEARAQAAELSDDMSRLAWTHAYMANLGYLAGDVGQGIVDADRAIELADASGDFVCGIVARGNLEFNLFLHGDHSRVVYGQLDVPTTMAIVSNAETADGVTAGQGMVMIAAMEERWDVADELLVEMSAVSRRRGLYSAMLLFAGVQASMFWRRGRWDEARALALEGLSDGGRPRVALAFGRATAAHITACMGNDQETHELAALALGTSTTLRVPIVTAWAHAALGQLELGKGRSDLALPHLDRVASLMQEIGISEPCFLFWHADWIDALIETGKSAEATQAIAALRQIADARGRRWARGVVERCSAQLESDPLVAEESFRNALKEFETLGMPFEAARTHMARGRHRQQRTTRTTQPATQGASQRVGPNETTSEAQEDIREALRIFRRIGAKHWSARAAALETDVVGSSTEEASAILLRIDALSPAEQRVASLIAAGRTNKQVSSELFISIKTVDFHVQAIYRKLDVRNRAEFVGAFTRMHA